MNNRPLGISMESNKSLSFSKDEEDFAIIFHCVVATLSSEITVVIITDRDCN